MYDPDYFRPLPSGSGEFAISKMRGTIFLRENGKNCIYMQGSKEIFLKPDDIIFIANELQNWLNSRNKIPAPDDIFIE